MRVTQQTISTQVTDGLQLSFQRLAKAQEVVTTGRRINHLSDDPIGATRALRLRGFEEALTQYQRNIDNTQPLLEQADSVLNDVETGLQRAKELALSLANGIHSPTERLAGATEVHQILGQILSQANTKIENRFLFGGFISGTAPFTEGASRIQYGGDNGEVAIQTNAASSLKINLVGSAVYQGAGVVGGQGIFDTLQDLEAALRGNSSANALTLAINLDVATVAGSGFSPANAVGTEAPAATLTGEADFAVPVTVFDDRGTGHNITFLFAKTGATTYKYRAVAEASEITGGTPGSLYQVAPEGTLAFNADGTLNAAGSTISNITLTGLADGASDITIAAANIGFAGSTQSGEPAAVLKQTQTNTNGLQAQLGRIDAALDQTLTFRAEVGARLNSAQTSNDALGLLKDRTVGQRSEIEDADVLSAYSDFARFQNAFQAALQSASQVLQPTLLDFLR
jgi:flagellar hook-associated protein 3 FlgL